MIGLSFFWLGQQKINHIGAINITMMCSFLNNFLL